MRGVPKRTSVNAIYIGLLAAITVLLWVGLIYAGMALISTLT